jgi:hypothetical protein
MEEVKFAAEPTPLGALRETDAVVLSFARSGVRVAPHFVSFAKANQSNSRALTAEDIICPPPVLGFDTETISESRQPPFDSGLAFSSRLRGDSREVTNVTAPRLMAMRRRSEAVRDARLETHFTGRTCLRPVNPFATPFYFC